MGGCRCCFRECDTGSQRNPDMHFFRFPLKDRERLKIWIEMADAAFLLNLIPTQQQNRMICCRHFSDDQFMNYKKDRLIGRAVPRLMRLSVKWALDYTDIKKRGKPTLIQLQPPTAKHLIMPAGFKCPLGLEDNAETDMRIQQIYGETIVETTAPRIHNFSQLKREAASSSANAADNLHGEQTTIAMDDECDYIAITWNNEQLAELQEQEQHQELMIEQQPIELVDTFTQTDKQVNPVDEQQLKQLMIVQRNLKKTEEVLTAERTQLGVSNKKLAKLEDKHACLLKNMVKVRESEQQLQKSQQQLQKQLMELQLKHQQTLTEMQELLQKCNKTEQQQNETMVSTSKEKSVNAAVAAITPNKTTNPLSKAQLFNGIKKYLSSSMVALLRMEMFGSAEREWKADERRTAVDLYRLGENVYKYFFDEWRLRLPAVRLVREWFVETAVFDEDEEL